MADTGRGSGIFGATVDFVNNGSNVQFGMKVMVWGEATDLSEADNTGQGSNGLESTLSLIEKGRLLLQGDVLRSILPFPTALKDATGQVTIYLSKAMPNSGQADIKMVAAYRFSKLHYDYAEKKDTEWKVTLGADRVSALVPSGWANNANQNTLASIPAGNTYLYGGRRKAIDENGGAGIIDNSQQWFNIWPTSADTDAAELSAAAAIVAAYATPPQTGEKVYVSSVVRLSDRVARVGLTWRPSNSQDILEQGGTYSSRSNFQPFVDVISQKYDSAADEDVIADALYSAFFQTVGPPYPTRLRVNKVNPNVARVTRTWLDPGILVFESLTSYPRYVPARLNGSTVEVWVAEKVQVCTGLYKYRLSRTLINIPIRLMTLRRMWSQSPPAPDFATISGYANNNTFLGLSAGTVFYRSAKLSTNISNTGVLPFFTDYHYSVDGNGIFSLSGFDEGWIYSTASVSAAAWVAVSALTGSGIVASLPAQTSFDVFLA